MVKIKVEGADEEKKKGQEQKESPGTQGVAQQQPQVVPDPLGYLNQTQASSLGAGPSIVGAPAMDLMNPTQPANHPDVDIMNPGKETLPKGADTAMQNLAQQIATPVAEEPTAFEKGYQEKEQMDAIRELVREASERTQGAKEELDNYQQLDAEALKNERSRKVIAGMGDAISSIVNLIGTMNGAYDQKQTFMEPRLRDAIEQDRAKRRLQMDKLRSNVQNQVNYENQIRLAMAKQDAAARQNAAALASKERIAAGKLAFDKWKTEGDWDVKRETNATNAEYKERDAVRKDAVAQSQIYRNNASASASTVRANAYAGYQNALADKARNGGTGGRGGGSGHWWDELKFDEFRDEMAQSMGYRDWDDARANGRSSDRKILNELAGADSPTKQRAVVQAYYSRTPNWTRDNWGYVTGDATPPAGAVQEDDNTPPSMRRPAQTAEDDNTPPSMRKKK